MPISSRRLRTAPPLAQPGPHGHVVYVRSLSKCAAPGLRIGAICARGAALQRLRMARLVDDFSVPARRGHRRWHRRLKTKLDRTGARPCYVLDLFTIYSLS